MNYSVNPIVDAFLLAGHRLSELQHGFRRLPETLIQEIQWMETVAPCKVCDTVLDHGWLAHASTTHCDNLDVQFDRMKVYRLSRGRECLLCNITYATDDDRLRHIRIHLGQGLISYYKLPIYKPRDETLGSNIEQAIRLKSFLHYNFYVNWNLKLYMMVPTWLRGDNVKEKLRSIDRPTYIPVSFGYKSCNLFTTELHMHYDLYSTLLYVPALDEKFTGVRRFNRSYGKLMVTKQMMIRLLGSLQQRPEVMKNIRFMLYKETKQPLFNSKYLVHVTDEDIREVLRDVITKKQSLICCDDLYDDEGCDDAFCTNFVHFCTNFTLEKEASHPLDRPKSLNRHDESRFQLGNFELIKNPDVDLWVPFAEEVIEIKNRELNKRTPYLVYVVLCIENENVTEMPTLQNVSDFYCEGTDSYIAYVGYSFRAGIPKHHFSQILNNRFDEIDSNMEEDDNRGVEARLVGSTELTKTMYRGNRALYMLRQYLEKSYEDAIKLEAVIQLYKKLSEENGIDNHFNIINKRLEMSAISYLTLEEIEVILKLIELNLPLLYDSPEALQTYLMDRNLNEVNWGVIQRPFFMTELERLPL